MPNKITRELHASVRETLKSNGIMTTAKIHELSPQTVSRIKRGGRYMSGYRRELAIDHIVREMPEYIKTPIQPSTIHLSVMDNIVFWFNQRFLK